MTQEDGGLKGLVNKTLSAAKVRLRNIRSRLAAGGIWGTSQDLNVRHFLSRRYLSGRGIEIGALHRPLNVPPQAHVTYVDRLPVSELRAHYPELESLEICEVDVIDDGERLETFRDRSLDFVIANHFLEHCEDPIGALENMLRVLRASGILYLAVPDKRYTFDKDRPVTTFAHLMRDHEEGPEWSRREHYMEFVTLVHKVTDEVEARAAAERYLAMKYSIHFHVWTLAELLDLFTKLPSVIRLAYDMEAALRNEGEIIFVLRRS